MLEANAINERETIAAVIAVPDGFGADMLLGFPALLNRLRTAAERVLMTAAERNDAGGWPFSDGGKRREQRPSWSLSTLRSGGPSCRLAVPRKPAHDWLDERPRPQVLASWG